MTGYHVLTSGFILGELVRRATGRTLAETLRTEIAGPLGVADELHFGVPGHLLARVARAGPDGAAPPPPDPGSPLDRALPVGVQPTAAFANRSDAPVRFLNLATPAGFEGYMRELGAAFSGGPVPTSAEMAEIASRYDFRPAPPQAD